MHDSPTAQAVLAAIHTTADQPCKTPVSGFAGGGILEFGQRLCGVACGADTGNAFDCLIGGGETSGPRQGGGRRPATALTCNGLLVIASLTAQAAERWLCFSPSRRGGDLCSSSNWRKSGRTDERLKILSPLH